MSRNIPHSEVGPFDMAGTEAWGVSLHKTAGDGFGFVEMSSIAGDDSPILVAGNDLSLGGIRIGEPSQPIGGTWKRVLDLAVAGLALIPALILMLVATIMIKMSMEGPVLFKHKRVGFNGKPFFCYKLRTMVCDGDRVLAEYLRDHPEAEREWRESRKLKRDPRVTFVGEMLRKSSIDELPQLFNVIRGDMSCVGPRPIVTDELSHYGSAAALYMRMRPGMTGLWQTSGRSNADYKKRVALDIDYGLNWSLQRDLLILVRTVIVIADFRDAA